MGRKSPEQEDAIRPDEVRLGRVSGVFGVSGELRLFLHNRESELFAGDGAVVTLVSPSGNRESHRLRSRHGAGKRILGRIEGGDFTGVGSAFHGLGDRPGGDGSAGHG